MGGNIEHVLQTRRRPKTGSEGRQSARRKHKTKPETEPEPEPRPGVLMREGEPGRLKGGDATIGAMHHRLFPHGLTKAGAERQEKGGDFWKTIEMKERKRENKSSPTT